MLVFLFNEVFELACLFNYFRRPFARNVVATQGNFDLHTWRHVVAHDFNDLTLRLPTHSRPLGNANFGVLSVLDAHFGARRD